MRAEQNFNRILQDYGHDVLHLQKKNQVHCTCYDRLTGSVDRTCPYCFGMGFVPLIVKQQTRDIDMRVPDSLPYIANQQQFGSLAVASRAYFFRKDVSLRVGDILIDVEWDNGRPIYKDGGIYRINHIDPQRFTKGQISFYKAYVADQPFNKAIRGFKIVQQAGKTYYQMDGGGFPETD